ncbi:MAG: VWA domain-containing protein [Bryobacteraceae bacterium]
MIRAALLALLLAQDRADIRSNVVNVQVPVTVLDKKGNFITGLTEDDFRLFDGDAPQSIKVDEAAHPVSLVVAVQSNSNTRDLFATLRKASTLLVPLIAGDSGEIAVVTFDQEVQILAPFTSNPAEIQTAFSRIKAGGGPHHLDDAALQSVKLLHSRGIGRKKVLLIIGEGFDQGSAVTPADVFSQAELDGVLIYTIKMKSATPETPQKAKNPVPPEARGPGPMGTTQTMTTDVQRGGYGPSLNEIYTYFRGLKASNNLSAYSQFTGARAQDFKNQKSLETAIENIGKEVHSQYLLTFAPQNREPGYHELTVHLPTPNLQVRARRGYWLAAQAEVR